MLERNEKKNRVLEKRKETKRNVAQRSEDGYLDVEKELRDEH